MLCETNQIFAESYALLANISTFEFFCDVVLSLFVIPYFVGYKMRGGWESGGGGGGVPSKIVPKIKIHLIRQV